jgi:hypothetical protein
MATLMSMDITGSLYPSSGSVTNDVGYLWYDTSDDTMKYSGWSGASIIAKELGNSSATASGSIPVPLGLSEAVYTQNLSPSPAWSYNNHTLESNYSGNTVRVVWEYNNGPSYRGDFQLDDFTLFGTSYDPQSGIASGWETSRVNTPSYTSVTWYALTNGTSTNRWNRDPSGTSSSSTGLTSGFTGTYYYYAETSGTSLQKYWLRSPQITISSNFDIKYYKAHYGSNVGDYKVYVDVIS